MYKISSTLILHYSLKNNLIILLYCWNAIIFDQSTHRESDGQEDETERSDGQHDGSGPEILRALSR